jgi:hypothetical protein
MLYAHKANCTQKPLIQNHLGSIHPAPLIGSGSLANTFNRSLVLKPTLLFFQTMLHENRCNSLAELLAQRKKLVTSQEFGQKTPISLPAYTFSKFIPHTLCQNTLLYWLLSRKKLRTSSIAPLFSTSQTASNTVIPTALAHNYSSTPHNNSAPPHSHVISLHAHSVAAAMHSFLYKIAHTPRERSPHALPCSSNGETAAEKKRLIKQT